MTKDEAMRMALEALEANVIGTSGRMPKTHEAITALREALNEPEQEPVAWISEGGDVARSKAWMDEMGFACSPLYPAPPRREWVSLTDEEIDQAFSQVTPTLRKIYQVIEAKLKEKNA